MFPGHIKPNNKAPAITKWIEGINGDGEFIERKPDHHTRLQVITG